MDNPASANSYHGQQFLQQTTNRDRDEYDVGPKIYGIQFLQQAIEKMDDSPKAVHEYLCHFMFTQMTVEAGIKKHGDLAVNALMAEFAQLDDLNVFKGLYLSELTREQKKEALRAINLIKEECCGKIKGRTVADGRPQRKYKAP